MKCGNLPWYLRKRSGRRVGKRGFRSRQKRGGILGHSELIFKDSSWKLDQYPRELVLDVVKSGNKLNRMVEEYLPISKRIF
jgi:hypothetical protein